MPTVRDILNGEPKPKPDSLAKKQDLDGDLSGLGKGPKKDAHSETAANVSEAQLIADSLRLAATQRATFALSEINRLQLRLNTLQENMVELTKQNLPRGDLRAELKATEHRLEDAKADLVRAREARENTDLTASLSQGRHESLAPQLHEHVGHGVGSPGAAKVRESMGTRDTGKLVSGPSTKINR